MIERIQYCLFNKLPRRLRALHEMLLSSICNTDAASRPLKAFVKQRLGFTFPYNREE